MSVFFNCEEGNEARLSNSEIILNNACCELTYTLYEDDNQSKDM